MKFLNFSSIKLNRNMCGICHVNASEIYVLHIITCIHFAFPHLMPFCWTHQLTLLSLWYARKYFIPFHERTSTSVTMQISLTLNTSTVILQMSFVECKYKICVYRVDSAIVSIFIYASISEAATRNYCVNCNCRNKWFLKLSFMHKEWIKLHMRRF